MMIERLAEKIARRAAPETIARLYTSLPQRALDRIACGNFERTVRWAARHSPFYQRAFAEHGIDPRRVKKPGDLGDFFTSPEDLWERPEEFLCRPPAIVFESSGTSGKNKRVYYSEAELRDMGRMMAAGFRMMGITPRDRIANAFDFSIWIPGMVTHYGLMAAGNFCLAFGKVDPGEVYRRLADYGFTVVMGEPTWLIRLTELAERGGAPPLRMLVGAAEEMPAAAIPWMQSVWGGARVKMCYGSVEQGSALGYQPCDQDGYHLDNMDFLSELCEPDAAGFGELIFTTLRRRVMPLIRYRTRDVTRLLPGRCPCGLHSPRIERLRGRRDELVVASGGNLYPALFEDLLGGLSEVGLDWQVVFRLEGLREVMEIHVEAADAEAGALQRRIEAEAARKYPDLMKNLALGIFELRTVVHAPGTMRAGRKLQRLVDLRYATEHDGHRGNGVNWAGRPGGVDGVNGAERRP